MKRFCLLAICFCMLGLSLPVTTGPVQADDPTVAQATTNVYLPLLRSTTQQRSIFGVEGFRLENDTVLLGLADLQTTWFRLNGLRWRDLQPTPDGTFNWNDPRIVQLEQRLLAAQRMNNEVVLIVRGSPQWATTPYAADCAPINPVHYEAFAQFLEVVVERYSQPPFNVRYWELGNEPDAFIFSGDAGYGCWGVIGDEFYGGRAYGEMLNVVYPRIKAVNPEVQVLNGGLLLDDPESPAGRFFVGMLEAGAGNSLDILAFHSYVFYTPGNPDGDRPDLSDRKIAYLRGLMQQYGVNKPLFNTEGALLCAEVSDECRLAQAHAIPRLFARAARDELVGLIWYALDDDSFRNTSLLASSNLSFRRPSYVSFQMASRTLQRATYQGPVVGLPEGAEGYIFRQGGRTIVVAWSNTPQTALIQVGDTPQCREFNGGAFACSATGGFVTVDLGPGPRYLIAGQP